MSKTNGEGIRTCYECRGVAQGSRENHMYSECGLKNVVLKDVVVYRCVRCGAENIEIPNMDGLHRTIALAVLCKGSLLISDEIKFLRKVAGLTAAELAKALGVTKYAVSRWENGGKIGAQSDRSIRITCGLAIIEEIVSQKMPVDLDDVKETLERLKKFLMQFNSRTLQAAISDEAKEAEKLLIDPEMPYAVSALGPAVSLRSSDDMTIH